MDHLALDRTRTSIAVERAARMARDMVGTLLAPEDVGSLIDILMDDVGIMATADPLAAAHVLALAYHSITLSHPGSDGGLADIVIACSDAADAAHLRGMGHQATTLFAFRQDGDHEHDLVIAVGLMGHDREGRRNVMSAPLRTRIALIEKA